MLCSYVDTKACDNQSCNSPAIILTDKLAGWLSFPLLLGRTCEGCTATCHSLVELIPCSHSTMAYLATGQQLVLWQGTDKFAATLIWKFSNLNVSPNYTNRYVIGLDTGSLKLILVEGRAMLLL